MAGTRSSLATTVPTMAFGLGASELSLLVELLAEKVVVKFFVRWT
jgi:hypothetical protein